MSELVVRYHLGKGQRAQLEAVLDVLETDEHAPTAVRERTRALEVHLADSLVALELEAVRTARTLADIGSGAGMPGAVLAVALPGARASLLDSDRRKCAFIEALLARARVKNARAVWARAEEWGEGMGANDLVTARALGPAAVVLEYAAPLLREGGTLVQWRGARDREDERAGARAAGELGMELLEIRRVEPWGGAREHHLHTYTKARETPARFPRRAGMARKRPLS